MTTLPIQWKMESVHHFKAKKKICHMFRKYSEILIDGEPLSTAGLIPVEEYPISGGFADIAILRNGEVILLIEVAYTHRTLSRPGRWIEVRALRVEEERGNCLYDEKICGSLTTSRVDPLSGPERKTADCQGSFRIQQRGAGCGKTYGIIQILKTEPTYDNYIYLTKMNTAKTVIYEELLAQQKQGFICEDFHQISGPEGKYIFRREDKRIVIGTVDSFIYQFFDVTAPTHSTKDYFENICRNMLTKPLPQEINYARGQIVFDRSNFSIASSGGLNRRGTLVIIDEAQDLGKSYYEVFLKMSHESSINILAVGDKLQSIFEAENIITLGEQHGLVQIDANIVRRFQRKDLATFVNASVNFEKFGLSPIVGVHPGAINCCDGSNHHSTQLKNCCDSVSFEPRLSSRRIIDLIRGWNCKPQDVTIILPFVSAGPCVQRAQELEDAIEKYWRHKKNKTRRFCYFHYAVEGQSIDLRQSQKCTRILSIHASKGLGSKYVIVLGLNEKSLRILSGDDPLKFESLLHVALTRVIERIVVEVVGEDAVSARFKKSTSFVNFSTDPLKYRGALDRLNIDDIPGSIQKYLPLISAGKILATPRDFNLHCARYAMITLIFAMKRFVKNPYEKDFSRQMYNRVRAIIRTKFILVEKWDSAYSGDYLQIMCSSQDFKKLSAKLRGLQYYLTRILRGEEITFIGVLNAYLFSYCYSHLKQTARRISCTEFVWVYKLLEDRGADETFFEKIECVHAAYDAVEKKMSELGGNFLMNFNEFFWRGKENSPLHINIYFYSETHVILCFVTSKLSLLNYNDIFSDIATLNFGLRGLRENKTTGRFRGKIIINCIISLYQDPIFFDEITHAG